MDSNDQDISLNSKNRARGVKASPTKLRAAMHSAGFKSQAEIALEIQQQEHLENPPRSMVGRVFRGEAVDPLSLERVANALRVESWKIYLGSTDLEMAATEAEAEQDSVPSVDTQLQPGPASATLGSRKVSLLARIGGVAFICVTLALLFNYSLLKNNASDLSKPSATHYLDFSDKVLIVLPVEGPRGDDLTGLLRQVISDDFHWVAGTALHAGVVNPLDVIQQKSADLVLSGKIERVGRNLILQLFATEGASSYQIWADTFSHLASATYLRAKLKTLFTSITRRQEYVNPDWAVLQRYAKGLTYMEGDRANDVLLRAMVEFESVVRLAPDFAKGYAALCVSLVEFSQLSGDKEKLAEAAIPCEKAQDLGADEIEVKMALAILTRKQGQFDQAKAQFEAVLQQEPNHVDAMRGLAELLMRLYIKQPEEALFTHIESMLLTAYEIEPDNWKIPYTTGRLYYFTGRNALAIEQFTLARNISPNYQTYVNLGTLEFCQGQLAEAKLSYQAALRYQPDELVLQSNIATLHQYLGENKRALEIYLAQLDTLKSQGSDVLATVWGNLGDTYRREGMIDQAVEAYKQALIALEQDIAKGETTVTQLTFRLAYYLTLVQLQPEKYTEDFVTQLRQQATEFDNVTDPESVHQMTGVWILLDERDKAKAMRAKLSAICPGYTASQILLYLMNNKSTA